MIVERESTDDMYSIKVKLNSTHHRFRYLINNMSSKRVDKCHIKN